MVRHACAVDVNHGPPSMNDEYELMLDSNY